MLSYCYSNTLKQHTSLRYCMPKTYHTTTSRILQQLVCCTARASAMQLHCYTPVIITAVPALVATVASSLVTAISLVAVAAASLVRVWLVGWLRCVASLLVVSLRRVHLLLRHVALLWLVGRCKMC